MSTAEAPLQYVVTGMTCQHCVASVTEEVSEVAGVSAVDVDLATGRVAVHGSDVDEEAVVAAVTEAGYKVVD
ncbi:heavy-metal-associated domain-containing protein [Patulibacter minatonensis]|uniref:heavy-metal-associated domain-containing protein n=1 Tax=Patulibacter minatonensis TaxID=298163 RepID=UPI00047E4D49|nr:heavy-metal-associated domain-containing protein [Patulibacter minatonensis]